MIHNKNDICRSKHLINLGCKLGFSVSYGEIERTDTDMVQRIIDQAGELKVPVPPSIDPKMVINAATGNFDQNDFDQKVGAMTQF